MLSDLALLTPEARRRVMGWRRAIRFSPTRAGSRSAQDRFDGRPHAGMALAERPQRHGGERREPQPFLDYRLAAWLDTPYRAKFGGPWNKRELRQLFDRFTPLPTAQRRDKQGFRWAFDHFFRNNLDAVLAMLTGAAATRRFVDAGLFADAVGAAASGSIAISCTG